MKETTPSTYVRTHTQMLPLNNYLNTNVVELRYHYAKWTFIISHIKMD